MNKISTQLHEKGQGLVEYALIMVLVSLVVIVVMSLLGPSISNVYCQVLSDLGQECETQQANEPEPEPPAPVGPTTGQEARQAYCDARPGWTGVVNWSFNPSGHEFSHNGTSYHVEGGPWYCPNGPW